MDSALHLSKLIIFCLLAAFMAVGVSVAAFGLGAPGWLGGLIAIGTLVVLITIARRQQTGRWGYGARTWTGTVSGRSVQLIFDERLVFLNRLTLVVEGEPVDRDFIWYGIKTLSGAGVTVRVGSGWIGECTGATVLGDDGTQPSLVESP